MLFWFDFGTLLILPGGAPQVMAEAIPEVMAEAIPEVIPEAITEVEPPQDWPWWDKLMVEIIIRIL